MPDYVKDFVATAITRARSTRGADDGGNDWLTSAPGVQPNVHPTEPSVHTQFSSGSVQSASGLRFGMDAGPSHAGATAADQFSAGAQADHTGEDLGQDSDDTIIIMTINDEISNGISAHVDADGIGQTQIHI